MRRRRFGSVLLAVVVSMVGSAGVAQATPAIWESSFGSLVLTADDSTTGVAFGFLFPFLGGSYGGAEVSSNGFLSLGGSNGAGCCDASVSDFLTGAARISPAWYDVVTSVYLNTSVAGRAVVTWEGHEFSNTTVNRFQAQLFSDGDIIFGYDVLTPFEDSGHRHHALTGVTGGGGAADPGETDYSASLPLSSGSTNYEFFARGPNGAVGGVGVDTFDLAGSNICYEAVGSTGWNISACGSSAVPEPGSIAFLLVGLLTVGVTCRGRAR